MMGNFKKAGFTLAEVMLTMTIVGVVAAMTIPTLSYNRAKKEYSAKLRNFYSRMENSILDSEMDNGSFKDLKRPTAGNATLGFEWYLKYIDPYMGHQYVDKTKRTVYYKDGSSLTQAHVGTFLEYSYDVNGDKAPNKIGYDRHYFLFGFSDSDRKSCFGNVETFFGVYCPAGQSIDGLSRDTLVARCRDGQAGTQYGSGVWCTRLLQLDQWEFKSDYPLKF